MASREELIKALAASKGMDSAFSTKFHENKYDKSTGTLYCDGYAISPHTINRAYNFFINHAAECKKLKVEDNDEMAMIYTVAVQAIKMMLDNPNLEEDIL